jgi:hypothetical protein
MQVWNALLVVRVAFSMAQYSTRRLVGGFGLHSCQSVTLRRVGARTTKEVSLRYVAVCDVLGFRALLDANGLGWIREKYELLERQVRECSRWEARSYIFSDTILFYSDAIQVPVEQDGTLNDLPFFLLRHRISGFLAWTAALIPTGLEIGLPLRGGVACGPCVIKQSRQIFLGQPIIDAYLVEQSQDWIGIALHQSCFSWFGRPPVEDDFYRLLRYQIPPNGTVPPVAPLEWSLDWPSTADQTNIQRLLIQAAEQHKGTRFEQRWQNTLDFFFATAERREQHRFDAVQNLRGSAQVDPSGSEDVQRQ